MLNKKLLKVDQTEKLYLSALLILLLSVMLAIQTCSAQSTQVQEDKAISFLRGVIQLDVDQYKFTLTNNITDEDTTYLTYKFEPKSFISFESGTMNFEFYNGNLTSFSVQTSSDCLVYTQPRLDRFNETLGILERYQNWLNDPQVDEMAALLRQVGSEQSLLQASGNLSLRIQQYSDIADYRFSNYINGVEYNGVSVAQSQSGSIYFSENRVSQKIGNTTIGVSEDQALAIAQNYSNSNPFRGSKQDSKEITNLNITGVKAVTIKSSPRINNTLYPYYDVQFTIADQSSSALQACGVLIGANDGEIWSSYSHSSSTNTIPKIDANFAFAVVLATLVVAGSAVAAIYISKKKMPRTEQSAVA